MDTQRDVRHRQLMSNYGTVVSKVSLPSNLTRYVNCDCDRL